MNGRVRTFNLSVALIVALAALVSSLRAQDTPDVEAQNIEAVYRLNEMLNTGKVSLEAAEEIHRPVVTVHGYSSPGVIDIVPAQRIAQPPVPGPYLRMRPVPVAHIFAEGDIVVAHLACNGTFENRLMLPAADIFGDDPPEPTGEEAEYDWVWMFRFEDGKSAELWPYWNREYTASFTTS